MKIEDIKKSLLERKAQLEETLTNMSRKQLSDGQVQDIGDQAVSVTSEILHSSLQDNELAEYRRIDAAIKKINEGTYGVCTDCGEQISEKRLLSFPNAERCISCQEIFEEDIE